VACFSPLKAYRAALPDGEGRRLLHFDKRASKSDEVVSLPCGQCVGCRLERSRQWAVRCMHEASLYDENCFVTLTYDPVHLPPGGGLRRRDVQLFLKKLRKASVKERGRSFRFYGCGEYGDATGRPHYHLLFFDLSFADAQFWRTSSGGLPVFRSEALEAIWKLGLCEVGSVTFESAAYVARYCLKKVNGKDAAEHYRRSDPDGRDYWISPEFPMFSNRPGIGAPWLAKFGAEVFPSDTVVVRGVKQRPPKYYTSLLERDDPNMHLIVKEAREPQSLIESISLEYENCTSRLAVREEVAVSRLLSYSKKEL